MKKELIDMGSYAYGKAYECEGDEVPECCHQPMLWLENAPNWTGAKYNGWFCDVCGSDYKGHQDDMFTIGDFWDCECPGKDDYIHSKKLRACPTCNSVPDDCADSRRNEVYEHLHDNLDNVLYCNWFTLRAENNIVLTDFVTELSELCKKYSDNNDYDLSYELDRE
ncbi:hypothetical protein KAR91_60285 [Candidatus Pacearchaeota archaeon]|nr:hypothetical protein [Candidatus Pacearchaeota archaeon]